GVNPQLHRGERHGPGDQRGTMAQGDHPRSADPHLIDAEPWSREAESAGGIQPGQRYGLRQRGTGKDAPAPVELAGHRPQLHRYGARLETFRHLHETRDCQGLGCRRPQPTGSQEAQADGRGHLARFDVHTAHRCMSVSASALIRLPGKADSLLRGGKGGDRRRGIPEVSVARMGSEPQRVKDTHRMKGEIVMRTKALGLGGLAVLAIFALAFASPAGAAQQIVIPACLCQIGCGCQAGGSSGDVLNGGAGCDFICGNGGNDTINGNAGDDNLRGNADVDTIHGNSGEDVIFGGSEDDFLYGDSENDAVHGDSGKDTISGGTENDSLFGDSGDDILTGDSGNDTADGGTE